MKRGFGHRLAAAALILLAGGGCFWWWQSQKVSLEDYTVQIQQLSNRGERQQALKLCDQAIQKYPQEGSLYEKKAQIYWSEEQQDLAMRTLDYGYKQTGWEQLKQLKELYGITEEEDVFFQEVIPSFSDTQQQMEDVEPYVSYELPEVSLPAVQRKEPPKEDDDETVEEDPR